MNPVAQRRFAVLIPLVLLLAVPSYAAKRRAVQHRTRPIPITATVTGTVTDSVTGAPVVGLTVSAGIRSASTDGQGRFEIKNAEGEGQLEVKTERSGYLPTTTVVRPGDATTLTLRVTPTPTVTLRLVSGQTLQVDNESLKFGYAVPFSGFRDSEFEDFCKSDGTKLRYHNSQLKRVAGPATAVAAPACCPSGNAMRMNVTLRTGETADLLFTDSCEDRYEVEMNARDHNTGIFSFWKITDIVEIVFP